MPSVSWHEAGCAVYCEKMSDTRRGPQNVAAMDRTVNFAKFVKDAAPRYRFALEQLIGDGRLFGQLVNINSQWNRALSSSQDIVSKPSILPDAKHCSLPALTNRKLSLEELRHRFLNWRFYKFIRWTHFRPRCPPN